ncbi:DUF6176 family protein [Pseudomonas sp. Gutcm_11s]|uniref:DUF6176 family protein n=1 Tax=Pseudomonas sp. Gutcm_11s TaxID=3026088 RepID=UPI00236045BE|nr:DUF6176 family protein [Pseudomonas sp. Gutcm_11s]MDD0843974.1 DUF6176 family protein [Pseudomonas sp. Gutcm_11s]
MDAKAVLIRLKPDTATLVADWREQILRLKEQAIESIRNEGIAVESWFQVQLAGEHYLLAYIRSGDIARAEAIGAQSTLEVDAVHRQFKRDTWDHNSMIPCELLVDLQA